MSDIPTTLQQALEARYALQAVIGRGGMATVYLATDLKHRRQVAIKVLRPDLAASLGAERFLKEIQIAARLNHPHILGLHDSGESAGFLYYVMPYVEGGSLRQQLERERRLDLAPALAIAGSVADALGYAHRMGVFHRDIKPENILFSQGHPIVADFGIAKAISTAGGVGGANLTRTGFPVGTPGYMSPEQAAGLTDLDERTDVYSLAVVVYEMLVGKVPRGWPGEDAVREARFLEAPASHRSRLAPLGPAVESALVRAMAIRHEQRTAGPAALLEQLRGAPPPSLPARRVYSEAEVERIVQRAAELEAQLPTQDGAMTIGGVERLAAEVGIAPEIVRRAAVSARPRLTAEPPIGANRAHWWLGAPLKLAFERVVEGEVPDVEFPLLIDEVRNTIGSSGIVSSLGRSVSYVVSRSPASGMGRDLQVSITVRGGKTRIVAREALGGMAGGVFGGLGGGLGGAGLGGIIAFAMGSLHNPAAIPVLVPLWLTAVFAGARSWFYYSAKDRASELQGLVDRLAELALDVIPQRPRLPSPPPAGRLPA